MQSIPKQTHTCDDKNAVSPEFRIETNPNHKTTYWGVLCRTCRELVAFDGCPYLSFGPGAAGMKPGAIRCGLGHNHIYFPRDFRFVDIDLAVPDAIMRQNRETYRAINPRPPASWIRPEAQAEPQMKYRNSGTRSLPANENTRLASEETYRLSAKPYLTDAGDFRGKLEGVMFIATSSSKTQQWFAIDCGQLEKDFGALVSHESATEILAALTRGDDIDFPSSFRQEQLDRCFHYQGSPVHFVLCASTEASRN